MEARCSTLGRYGVSGVVALTLIHLLNMCVEACLAQVLKTQLRELVDPALGQRAPLHGQIERIDHVKIKFEDCSLADFFYGVIYSINYGRFLIRRDVLILYLTEE